MTYIIILTWNGKKYLSKLFNSLENLTTHKKSLPADRQDYKILVLDSGSTDGTIDFLKKLASEEKIIFKKLDKNYGFAEGNNIGMREAIKKGAENIVLLNQDTFVKQDFLEKLLTTANSDKKIGVVQPLILHYDKPEKIQSWGNDLHYLGYGWSGGNWQSLIPNHKSLITKNIPYASGAAVLYKTDMLKKIGLFDKNFFSYHEDSDLCLRAKLAGYRVILSPKSIVHHAYDFPTDKNKIRYFWNEKNRIYLMLKTYKFKTLVLVFPMALAMDIGQLFFTIKRGYVWQWLKAHFWFIFNLHKLIYARYKTQKLRTISDKELTKLFSSEIKYQPVSNFLLDKIGNPIMKAWWKIIKNFL